MLKSGILDAGPGSLNTHSRHQTAEGGFFACNTSQHSAWKALFKFFSGTYSPKGVGLQGAPWSKKPAPAARAIVGGEGTGWVLVQNR